MSETDFAQKKWVRVTAVNNIPLREGRVVRLADHDIAIFNLGDRFFALENKCPHRGGPLADGIISGNSVVCPLHAWKTDLATGEVINQASNPPCVKSFSTRVENGVVLVEIPCPSLASAEVSTNCLASVSRVPYLNDSASSEV